MISGLRVALFVEGSASAAPRAQSTWLERIWNDHLVRLAGCGAFEFVFPISKKDIVALDQPVTGAEPLDMKLVRLGAGTSFDAAVVAWDLYPEWNGAGQFCRWEETKRLYELLGGSRQLPAAWRTWASQKHADYAGRATPAARTQPQRLRRSATIALCMDPEFEACITCDEAGVKRALGVSRSVPDWPRDWGQPGLRTPGDQLLGNAIRAARASGVRGSPVRGDWRTSKNEWDEYFLRRLRADSRAVSSVAAHPIAQRLREICA